MTQEVIYSCYIRQLTVSLVTPGYLLQKVCKTLNYISPLNIVFTITSWSQSFLCFPSQTGVYEPIEPQGTAAGSDGPEAGTSDIEYSDINLFSLKQESLAEDKPKTSDTKYAKIKPKGVRITEEGEEHDEEEVKLCMSEAAESEIAAVYSKVKKLKDKI